MLAAHDALVRELVEIGNLRLWMRLQDRRNVRSQISITPGNRALPLHAPATPRAPAPRRPARRHRPAEEQVRLRVRRRAIGEQWLRHHELLLATRGPLLPCHVQRAASSPTASTTTPGAPPSASPPGSPGAPASPPRTSCRARASGTRAVPRTEAAESLARVVLQRRREPGEFRRQARGVARCHALDRVERDRRGAARRERDRPVDVRQVHCPSAATRRPRATRCSRIDGGGLSRARALHPPVRCGRTGRGGHGDGSARHRPCRPPSAPWLPDAAASQRSCHPPPWAAPGTARR